MHKVDIPRHIWSYSLMRAYRPPSSNWGLARKPGGLKAEKKELVTLPHLNMSWCLYLKLAIKR